MIVATSLIPSIVIPAEGSPTGVEAELDTLDPALQRKGLIWLIESLPRISEIKEHLEAGRTLSDLVRQRIAHQSAIKVLRWVICSCRAYLKDNREGEGMINAEAAQGVQAMYHGQTIVQETGFKQFRFVVGSPEQEDNFRKEIEVEKQTKPSLEQYPTLLAFHGGFMLGQWR